MRRSALVLLALLATATAAVAHSNGTCPPRGEYIVVDLTSVTPGGQGTIYWVDYEFDMMPTGQDHFYMESGAEAGVQTGGGHVILGSTWGHDHNCYHPVAAGGDYLLY